MEIRGIIGEAPKGLRLSEVRECENDDTMDRTSTTEVPYIVGSDIHDNWYDSVDSEREMWKCCL